MRLDRLAVEKKQAQMKSRNITLVHYCWLLLAPLALLLIGGCGQPGDSEDHIQGVVVTTPTGTGEYGAVIAVVIATPQLVASPLPVTPLGNGQYAIVAPTPAPLTPTPTATPASALLRNMLANERVVFVSDRDGNREIYVMNGDGSQPIRLTSHNADEIEPAWSPDGWQIAFASDREGNYEIYLTSAENGSLTRLTDDPAMDRYPAWSPDGQRLAFVSNRDGNFEIYTIGVDDSQPTRLTYDPTLDRYPAWSPDGQYLAFESNRDGNPEIYILEVACASQPTDCDRQPIRLTQNPALDSKPAWSPDGQYLAFESDRHGNLEIYVMEVEAILRGQADGNRPIRLTDHPAWDYQPAWLPNSQQIIFTSTRDSNTDIYIMNIEAALQESDDSRPVRLTQDVTVEEAPAWTSAAVAAPTPVPTMIPPTGKIAFVSERDGSRDIYVMNADGSQPINLTNHPMGDYAPVWSPDGQQLAFVSDRSYDYEIYVINAECASLPEGCSQQQVNLTNDPGNDDSPRWSPDGRQIAFISWRDGNPEIYVMNTECVSRPEGCGSGPTNLTNHPALDEAPAWSPDGQRIAFVTQRNGGRDIYIMNSDGSQPTHLDNHPAWEGSPTWSPDGQHIAFVSNRDDKIDPFAATEIYVMNTGGSQQTRLTHMPGREEELAWSPNGQYLAFVSEQNGDIYTLDVACASQPTGCDRPPINLTNAPGEDRSPQWSPDGQHLLFLSTRDGYREEIYVMSIKCIDLPEGCAPSYPTRLTNNMDVDISPAWAPK